MQSVTALNNLTTMPHGKDNQVGLPVPTSNVPKQVYLSPMLDEADAMAMDYQVDQPGPSSSSSVPESVDDMEYQVDQPGPSSGSSVPESVDDMEYQDRKPSSLPPAKRAKTKRSGKPKIFRCEGYGDCTMEFTRAEHLARHKRKHTGEKPYTCAECGRSFSRFDNMVQHTNTHDKSRVKGKGKAKSKSPPKKRGRKPSPPKGSVPNFVADLPSPPMSRRESEDKPFIILPHPFNYQPPSPESDSLPTRRRSAPTVYFQTHARHQSAPQEVLPHRKLSILCQLSGYLVQNPDKSPHDFSPPSPLHRRRLSIQDLVNSDCSEEEVECADTLLDLHYTHH